MKVILSNIITGLLYQIETNMRVEMDSSQQDSGARTEEKGPKERLGIMLTRLSGDIEDLARRSQDGGVNNQMKEIVAVLRSRQGVLKEQYDLYSGESDGSNLYAHFKDHERYITMSMSLVEKHIEEARLSSEITGGKFSFAQEPQPGPAGIGSGQARGQKKSANPITEFFRYVRSVIKSAVSAIIKNISQMFSGISNV